MVWEIEGTLEKMAALRNVHIIELLLCISVKALTHGEPESEPEIYVAIGACLCAPIKSENPR